MIHPSVNVYTFLRTSALRDTFYPCMLRRSCACYPPRVGKKRPDLAGTVAYHKSFDPKKYNRENLIRGISQPFKTNGIFVKGIAEGGIFVKAGTCERACAGKRSTLSVPCWVRPKRLNVASPSLHTPPGKLQAV